jgi:periplasmic protein TonB
MFDKLVESTNLKRTGRRGRYFLTTTLAYAGALTLLGVATVFWFNPALAETVALEDMLPPPITSAPPEQQMRPLKPQPEVGFVVPTTPPRLIPDARTVPPSQPRVTTLGQIIPGAPNVGAAGNGAGLMPGVGTAEAEPPPPPPMPKPSPTVAPTPQQAVRMTSTMLQGKAVKRVQPPYPQIAKIGRISGAVQVQVMISEDGTVDSASVLSGHPLLRDASVQAARQWVFSPTILNGQPVRVVGILTFNFTLN